MLKYILKNRKAMTWQTIMILIFSLIVIMLGVWFALKSGNVSSGPLDIILGR